MSRSPNTIGATSPVFGVQGGGLQCADIVGDTTEEAGSSGPIVQPANRSLGGTALAPGRYSSVRFLSMRDVCVWTSFSGFYLVGMQGNVYAATGTHL